MHNWFRIVFLYYHTCIIGAISYVCLDIRVLLDLRNSNPKFQPNPIEPRGDVSPVVTSDISEPNVS